MHGIPPVVFRASERPMTVYEGTRAAPRGWLAAAQEQWTRSSRAARLPIALALLTVLLQVLFPLLDGRAGDVLTMVVVTVFCAASVSHALVWRGPAFTAALVLVSAGGGLLVESAGTRTGVPFGAYEYTGVLRPEVMDVPWVIPLAWTMMAYPSLLVARRVLRGRARVAGPLLAAAALATWDLFLDPQMVAAGYWVWGAGAGGAPTVLGIPLSNYAGWYLVALVMMAVLWPLLPDGRRPATADDTVPYGLYLWTWGGSVVAHAVFLGLPGSALLGGVGMGAVAVPFLLALRRPRAA